MKAPSFSAHPFSPWGRRFIPLVSPPLAGGGKEEG